MNLTALNQAQLDLLFHAGIYGLCRIPAHAVEDVNALREAGLVELNDERCFSLTRDGEQHVIQFGGRLTARHLH
ncbi:MAG: hypothetical protein ABJD97_07525 [Betaproteobacteria bacterium]